MNMDDINFKKVLEVFDKELSRLSEKERKNVEQNYELRAKLLEKIMKKFEQVIDNSLEGLSSRAVKEEAKLAAESAREKRKSLENQLKEWKSFQKEHTQIVKKSSEEKAKKEAEYLNGIIDSAKKDISAAKEVEGVYSSFLRMTLTEREKREASLEKKKARLDKSTENLYDKEKAYAEFLENNPNASDEKKEAAKKEVRDAQKEYRKAQNAINMENWRNELKDSLKDSMKDMLSSLTNAVDSNLETLGGYQAGMMARLQGSSSDFDDMVSLVRRNLAGSPLVKQKDVLDNLQKLTEKGIAYDLEQRAFLATVSDKIATTFDATNGTLLRLIRVQQADTTAARLGMEANLTRMLNAMFSDTSYLSDVYGTVSDAILDANSQLSRDNSVAFEYTVQKWLGALYSLGLSQGAVSSIAQGINLLGTGNVSALAGNEQLQTLLAMSASKGGLAYADLLIDGLDSSETNKLLRGMSEYLKEIAEGADNQVVKNAFAQVFGLSVSDFAALQNLTSGEIENIYNQNMGYSGAMGELTYQLSQIGSRVPLGQHIKNVFDNIMFATASEIFESPASYVTYLITDAIEQVTGGIPLPAVYAFGTGLDLTAFTVEGIIKDAIVGINLLKNIPAIFGSMFGGGGVSLSNWGGEPGYLTRGNEFINISFGAQRSTSSGTYVGSASSTDMKSSSISSAAEEGKEFKSASGQEDVEYAKAVPALEKGGAEMWLKWLKAMTTELNENPLPVKIAEQSIPLSVQMVFGNSDGLAPNIYTMENLIKAVVDAYNDGSQAFKVESTNSFIDAVNNAYSGGV